MGEFEILREAGVLAVIVAALIWAMRALVTKMAQGMDHQSKAIEKQAEATDKLTTSIHELSSVTQNSTQMITRVYEKQDTIIQLTRANGRDN